MQYFQTSGVQTYDTGIQEWHRYTSVSHHKFSGLERTQKILSNYGENISINDKLIYKYENESEILNCFSSKAGTGTNSVYIGIWDSKTFENKS